MLKEIVRKLTKLNDSISVDDPKILQPFIDNQNFPYLVSFPRTGSHWLRMVMELYFEKPSLIRAFYIRNATEFTCYHKHDWDLDLYRENVIYLYRNPVETVYSALRYYKEDPSNHDQRQRLTDHYARHLIKWIVGDDFTRKKTVITYERMKLDMASEFAKVCDHLGEKFNLSKLESALESASKDELKKRTAFDQQVVNLSTEYQMNGKDFANKYSDEIYSEMLSLEPKLETWLSIPD